jgi:hypothetical protein
MAMAPSTGSANKEERKSVLSNERERERLRSRTPPLLSIILCFDPLLVACNICKQ